MTPAGWRSVSRNGTSDATAALRAVGVRGVPVPLVLAGHDRNVDVAETEAEYRRTLPPGSSRVDHWARADHGLAGLAVIRSGPRAFQTAVLEPRALFTPGYLAARHVPAPGGESRRCDGAPCQGAEGGLSGARG
ncbi:hypothetical protein AB0940_18225 [Streptomyces sp. NPDC006656]|uniref:hypothetical protein n=1 Tax=Streptomyces sp. NPDC006656 TaxID=3156899 RepID=UPI0034558198